MLSLFNIIINIGYFYLNICTKNNIILDSGIFRNFFVLEILNFLQYKLSF